MQPEIHFVWTKQSRFGSLVVRTTPATSQNGQESDWERPEISIHGSHFKSASLLPQRFALQALFRW